MIPGRLALNGSIGFELDGLEVEVMLKTDFEKLPTPQEFKDTTVQEEENRTGRGGHNAVGWMIFWEGYEKDFLGNLLLFSFGNWNYGFWRREKEHEF